MRLGFIEEMEKLSLTKRQFARYRDKPFAAKAPAFKALRPMQKTRILAGIGANVGFGVLPIAAGAYYLGRRAIGKDPTYKQKYEELQKKTEAREKALEILGRE
jgi:hypothetical protein